ncbi:MAG: tyrosine recombinase XerC [Clostridiales bacterium]|nr:tyrosine recombinase XerC [Clostridiales bacterium]
MEGLPPLVNDFVRYKITVQNRSVKTVEQYAIDLNLFFRYIIVTRDGITLTDEALAAADLRRVDLAFVQSITQEDIYSFLMYTALERGNSAKTRARKASSLRAFFKYLFVTKQCIDQDPAENIEAPSVRPSLPKYLSLDESLALLDTVKNDSKNPNRVRDFCMLTLFLNCGIRLSELVGINLYDIEKNLKSMRVVGKGSKERVVYLNEACRNALGDYLPIRGALKGIKEQDKNALFTSRLGNRICNKTVQYTVYKYLETAGLAHKHYSTHKLRHTAATLMYQTGKVDVRVLKDILGHEQLNTTQIYTHISDTQMEQAMEENPLSGERRKNTHE